MAKRIVTPGFEKSNKSPNLVTLSSYLPSFMHNANRQMLKRTQKNHCLVEIDGSKRVLTPMLESNL